MIARAHTVSNRAHWCPMERAPVQTPMPGAQGRRLAKCSNTLAGFNGMVLLARFHVRHAPLKPPLKHALGAIQAVRPPAVDRADGLPGVHGPKYQYHPSPCSGSKRSSTHPAQRRASAHDVLLRRFLPIRLQRGAPVLQKTGYTAGRKFLGDAALAKRLTAWRNGTETPWLEEAPVHPLRHAGAMQVLARGRRAAVCGEAVERTALAWTEPACSAAGTRRSDCDCN